MTEKERKAVEDLRKILYEYEKANECGLSTNDFKEDIKTITTILNLIQKLETQYIVNMSQNLNNAIKEQEKNNNDLELLHEGWKIELAKKEETIKKLESENEKKDKIIEEAYKEVNNVLYFDDSSDYCSALWETLGILNPDLEEYPKLKYIE